MTTNSKPLTTRLHKINTRKNLIRVIRLIGGIRGKKIHFSGIDTDKNNG